MRKRIFSLVGLMAGAALFLAPSLASAQTVIASDNASNYGSWTNGSNEGTGFGPWAFSINDNPNDWFAGAFIGNPVGSGIAASMPNPSFALYANPFGPASATVNRPFAEPMKVGDTLSFLWAINWDSAGGNKGFSIFSGGDELVNVNNGGSQDITVNGDNTGFTYGTEAMTWSFEMTAADTLVVSATSRNPDNDPYSTSITISGAPDSLRFYAASQDGGDNRNPWFNNLQITETDVPTPTPTPVPSPTPSPTPEPSPTPSPTPEPSPTPSPTPEPSPEPSPTPSPTPEPSPTPSPTPEPSPEPSPTPSPSPVPSPTPPPFENPTTLSISVGSNDSYTFPLFADLSVTITFGEVTTGGDLTILWVSGDGDAATLGLDTSRLAGQLFVITADSSLEFDSADIVFELDGGFFGANISDIADITTAYVDRDGTLTTESATPDAGNGTVSVFDVEEFSTWYFGDSTATVSDWETLN